MKRAATTLAIALLVLSPLGRSSTWDDFPISSYPMFSRGDMGGVHGLAHAIVVHADGRRTPATPTEVGSPEPMVANQIIVRAVLETRTPELCRLIASHVHDADAVAVELVVSAYDARKYFVEGKREPEARDVHATCPVTR